MSYVSNVRDDLAAALPDVPDPLLDLYTLLAFAKGVRVTSEDVHTAWSIAESSRNPRHRSLVPFDELSADTQAKDDEYRDAIAAVAPAKAKGWRFGP